MKSAPAAVSQLFLHSDSTAPRLRVGLLVDEGGIPAYARGVIEDLCGADYVDIAFVGVRPSVARKAGLRDRGIALRAYAWLIESRYRMYPDPLESARCDHLLAGVPHLTWPSPDASDQAAAASARIAATPVDITIDFCVEPAREPGLLGALHGDGAITLEIGGGIHVDPASCVRLLTAIHSPGLNWFASAPVSPTTSRCCGRCFGPSPFRRGRQTASVHSGERATS